MAMTKKEQQAFQDLHNTVSITKALRWSDLKAKRQPLPKEGISFGWDFNEYRVESYGLSGAVYEAWTDKISHGKGHKRNLGSQEGKHLYATRCEALIGLRMALEQRFAKALAQVDEAIAEETVMNGEEP